MTYPAAYRPSAPQSGGFQEPGAARPVPGGGARVLTFPDRMSEVSPRGGRFGPPTRIGGGPFARPAAQAAAGRLASGAALQWAGRAIFIVGRLSPWIAAALIIWELADLLNDLPNRPPLGRAVPGGFYFHHDCGLFNFGVPQEMLGNGRDAGGGHAAGCNVNPGGGSIPPFGDAYYTITQQWQLGGFFNVDRDWVTYWRDAGINFTPGNGDLLPDGLPPPAGSPSPAPAPQFWPYAPPGEGQPNPAPVPIPLVPYLPQAPIMPEGPERGYEYPNVPYGEPRPNNPRAPRHQVFPRNRPLPHGPAAPRKPEPKEKERKVHINNIGGSVGQAFRAVINAVTETRDAVNAIYNALPRRYRPHRFVSPQEKAWLIYKHANELDVPLAIQNLIEENLKDQFWGRIGKGVGRASRLRGGPIGYQTGPAI